MAATAELHPAAPAADRSQLVAWLVSFFEADSPHVETRRLRLVRAVRNGHLGDVRTQLKLHPTDIALVDAAGQTPLFYARDTLMVEELCKLGADKAVRDNYGRTVLMAYSEQKLQNLALQLLLNDYDVNKSAETRPAGAADRQVSRYDTDLIYAVLSKDYLLLELLLAFGIDLNAEKLSVDLKHLTLKEWEKDKSNWSLQYIYCLLDKFGEPDRDEDKELAAQVPKRPELRVPRYSKNLKQFLAEKNASESLKRRFCRILLEEQQFIELKEIITPSEKERLEILEDIYEEAQDEEKEMGSVPKTKAFRLLSLDGGGMKGIVPTHVLLHMEKRLHDEFGGLKLVDQFDMFSATSTGSIVSALMMLGHDLKETRKTYFLLKDQIFSVSGVDNRTKVYEEILKSKVPPTIRLEESQGIRRQYLVVTTTRMDVNPVAPNFFRNFTYGDSMRKTWREEGRNGPMDCAGPQYLWEAVRCSSAAPTYFAPYRWQEPEKEASNKKVHAQVYSDGGLCNNNPTLQAFTEITNLLRHLNRHKTGAEETRLTAVLSLGCSHRDEAEVDSETLSQLSHLDKPRTLFDYLSFALYARGLGALLGTLEDSATNTMHGVDEAQAWSHAIGAGFLRFDPTIPFNVELDTTKSEMLVAMLLSTEFQLRVCVDQIEAFLMMLALDPRDK